MTLSVLFQRNLNFHIITGILNDIKPESETASPGPGYLDPTQKHIIVPDFIYKIVIDASSNTGEKVSIIYLSTKIESHSIHD